VAGGSTGATIVSAAVIFHVEAGAAVTVPAESRTAMVKPYVPIAVGVPLRMPVVAPIPIPGGRVPAERKNVYGGDPPEAVNVTGETGAPRGAGGRTGAEAVIVRGAAVTVSERMSDVPVACWVSVAATENVNVPAFVGVPEITPVVEPIERPGGRLPLASVHA
jgi:hypothetical protein